MLLQFKILHFNIFLKI